jgi:hypothetical protein
VPFAPFIDALDDHVGALPRRRLEGEQVRELAQIFPALGEPVGACPALEAERYRLHRAGHALLRALAATRPLVLVLDDLHWADEASLELFEHLLRRPPPARLLLAVGYRPRAALARVLAECTSVDAASSTPAPRTMTGGGAARRERVQATP